ncbi:hypothetical protein I7I51_06165, partial [Histoplasma capsulatum]
GPTAGRSFGGHPRGGGQFGIVKLHSKVPCMKLKENKIIVSLILNPSLWAQQKVREGIVKSWVM